MEFACPVDVSYADEISALLKPLPPNEVQEYFDQLIATRGCRGLRVKQNEKHGKGVYADVDFKEGDLILKDQILVGVQHSANKIHCLVCSFCFRFIGSIELQIGRKLYFEKFCASPRGKCHQEDGYGIDSSESEVNLYAEDHYKVLKQCALSSSKSESSLSKEGVESLMNGDFILPNSKRFLLPPAIPCPGGCKEAYYCCQSCAEADWDLFHSLLCTGPHSNSLNKDALLEFIKHANETNDVFLLAAKVVSFTILKYRKLKAAKLGSKGKIKMDRCDLSLLLEAWKPMSLGYKRRWWECIALPDDVDCCEETAFRMQIKELAFEVNIILSAGGLICSIFSRAAATDLMHFRPVSSYGPLPAVTLAARVD